MANIRLYQFPTKASPVPADIVYLGDSANSFDEVQSTIAELIAAYPNLSGIAGLTLGANTYPYSNNSAVITAGTITTLAVSLLADTTTAAMQSTLGLTSTPTASSFAGWDTNKNLSANNFLSGYATTATAAATTTLTVASAFQQFFTGSTTQTVVMPVTSTLVLGQQFYIVNNSSGVVTVQSSGANTIQAMAANTTLLLTCILTSGTTAASWNAQYILESAITLPLSLANGGTNASLTASNGGIFYSTGSAGAILAGTATANQVLLSGSSSAPAWSTATYPATTTINQLLYSSSANTITGLATVTTAVLTTSSGVPTWASQLSLALGGTNAALTAANGGIVYSGASALAILAAGTSGQLLQSGGAGAPNWTTATYPSTAGTANNILTSGGTNWSSATLTSVIDAALGNTQGDILYRSGSAWTVLAPGTAGFVLKTGGAGANPSWVNVSGVSAVPTQQRFTSGSGTYTTPAGCLYIRVRMVGGGGGGGAGSSTNNGGTGGTGGTTTFGSSLLTCTGGAGGTGTTGGTGGAGGAATLNAPAFGSAFPGAQGSVAAESQGVLNTYLIFGGNGAGSSLFGGGGAGGTLNAVGVAGVTNTGGGGGGGANTAGSSSQGGRGGGSGASIDAIITSPSTSYSYAVGAAGTAGATGTGGFAGGAGAAGYIEVTEFYQ